MTRNKFFERGELSLVAEHSGISVARLSDIFARRRNTRLDTAKKISVAVFMTLDKEIPWAEIINAKNSTHPAFTGTPENKRKG